MVDYDKINKTVQELLQLHPDVSEYVLWILTTDYYLKEEKGDILAARAARQREREDAGAASPAFDDEDDEQKVQALKKQALEAYERAQEELKTTKYENIKIEA